MAQATERVAGGVIRRVRQLMKRREPHTTTSSRAPRTPSALSLIPSAKLSAAREELRLLTDDLRTAKSRYNCG